MKIRFSNIMIFTEDGLIFEKSMENNFHAEAFNRIIRQNRKKNKFLGNLKNLENNNKFVFEKEKILKIIKDRNVVALVLTTESYSDMEESLRVMKFIQEYSVKKNFIGLVFMQPNKNLSH